jgi:hypothetical protein
MRVYQPSFLVRALRFGLLLLCMASLTSSTCGLAQTSVDFQRDIQPIFSEHCSHCHGSDASTREGGLRLDIREYALAGGESGKPAISINSSVTSHLVERIEATDPDSIMPPPSSKKPLSKLAQFFQLLVLCTPSLRVAHMSPRDLEIRTASAHVARSREYQNVLEVA